MAPSRFDEILTGVNALARAEHRPLAVRHVCHLCATALHVDGAALYLIGGTFPIDPVFATDPVSEDLAEAQVMLGEGPALDCLNSRRVLTVADLGASTSLDEWPMFASLAVAAGMHAVTAFPLMMDLAELGVLELHRRQPGGLTSAQRHDGEVFAEFLVWLLLDRASRRPRAVDAGLFADGLQHRWATVNRAAKAVATQLESDTVEAALRLCATALVQGRRLSDVADDVVAGRLRYQPDPR